MSVQVEIFRLLHSCDLMQEPRLVLQLAAIAHRYWGPSNSDGNSLDGYLPVLLFTFRGSLIFFVNHMKLSSNANSGGSKFSQVCYLMIRRSYAQVLSKVGKLTHIEHNHLLP